MEDTKKTNQIIKQLNATSPTGQKKWQAAEGFHAIPAANIRKEATGKIAASTDISEILVVKVFVNGVTSEVRTFYYKQVTKD